MKIYYRNKKLEKILTNDRQMKKHYTSFYDNLRNRLFELKAVSNLSLISHNPPPRRHKLSGDYEGFWSIAVSRNFRILFTAYNRETKDEININEIVIEDIKDTH